MKKPRQDEDDPYCAFRDDRERRNALISRDIRLVLTRTLTVILGLSGAAAVTTVPWKAMLAWVGG